MPVPNLNPGKPYDAALALEICDRLACSDMSLTEVLDSIGRPISEATWYRWRLANDDLRELSAWARECQGEFLADKAVVESRTERSGTIVRETESGPRDKQTVERMKTTTDNIERSRLIVHAYFKRAGQLNKALGERIVQAGDPDSPLLIKVDREETIGKLLGPRSTPPAA
jgi:hypothetical protein